eukprot:SAG31_NODE_123_length_23712_cov_41.426291_22_plen_104_part_00
MAPPHYAGWLYVRPCEAAVRIACQLALVAIAVFVAGNPHLYFSVGLRMSPGYLSQGMSVVLMILTLCLLTLCFALQILVGIRLAIRLVVMETHSLHWSAELQS